MPSPHQPDIAGEHPIGVVAERTGLTPDVLRVWERRYGAVRPQRSEGRQRFYSDADIERLRLLRLATLPGRSISKVVKLSTEALARLVEEDVAERARVAEAEKAAGRAPDRGPVSSAGNEYVELSLVLARALDSNALEFLLRRAVATVGLPAFLESLAAPLLRRVGDEWHAGRMSPAHEHLVSSLVRRVTISFMQSLSVDVDAPNLVVVTPAGERHEAGALFVAATAMAEGWRVTYLGADLPAADIAMAADTSEARAVAVSIVYPVDRRQLLSELKTLRGQLPPAIDLVVGGGGAAALAGDLAALGVRVASRLADALPVQS